MALGLAAWEGFLEKAKDVCAETPEDELGLARVVGSRK